MWELEHPVEAGTVKTNSGKTVATVAKTNGPTEETDLLDSGFTIREISPQTMRVWLVFQIVSLLFQAALWSEISGHLDTFEGVVASHCNSGRSQHGVCVGDLWNVSAWQDVVLPHSSGGDRRFSFDFTTHSSPPTFLVGVDPVAHLAKDAVVPVEIPSVLEDGELSDQRWTLEVVRLKPPQITGPFTHHERGQRALTFEDLSVEAKTTLQSDGKVVWRATLSVASRKTSRTRFEIFVEDAASPHLAQIHSNAQCSLGASWKAFNEHHQGHSHSALAWCRYLLGIFLISGAAAVALVHKVSVEGVKRRHRIWFHLIVFTKFMVQDVPQQLCIVLYLLGWYEDQGLRCQLCLFDPSHCIEEQPLHMANFVALTCTLLSAMSNQLLVRPIIKSTYTEDDICLQGTVRVGGTCVATLPFTTALLFTSQKLLIQIMWAPTLVRIFVAVPCCIGWVTVTCVCCLPLIFCCDEDLQYDSEYF